MLQTLSLLVRRGTSGTNFLCEQVKRARMNFEMSPVKAVPAIKRRPTPVCPPYKTPPEGMRSRTPPPPEGTPLHVRPTWPGPPPEGAPGEEVALEVDDAIFDPEFGRRSRLEPKRPCNYNVDGISPMEEEGRTSWWKWNIWRHSCYAQQMLKVSSTFWPGRRVIMKGAEGLFQ